MEYLSTKSFLSCIVTCSRFATIVAVREVVNSDGLLNVDSFDDNIFY